MPVYTTEPTSVIQDYLTPTGTTSEITALTDASDTTYCKQNHASLPSVLGYSQQTIGAGERIVSVCPYARVEGGSSVKLCHVLGLPNYVNGAVLSVASSATKADYELEAHEGQLLNPSTGGEWSVDEVDHASAWRDFSGVSTAATLYEHGLYLYAYEAATVANPSAPTGTITTTQQPTCTATVSSIVESWQVPSGEPSFYCDVDIEWSIYAGSLTAPSGTALQTWETRETIDTYGDGVTPTTLACSTTPPAALQNGSYTLFARVSRTHPSGVDAWSAYGYKQFAVSLTLPTAPTVAVAVDNTNQRMGVTVTAPTTTGYTAGTYTVSVEREVETDVWAPVRGMTDVALTEDAATLIGYDYEADRGVTNTYRACVTAYHTSIGADMTGAWTEDTETGPTVSGWNLKAVEDAGLNWIGAGVLTEPSESGQRQSAVFSPLYRDLPVVVSGVTGGFGGGFTVLASGTTEVATLEALADYTGLVLLETAFGDARYIRPTSWSWTRSGTAAAPRRTAAVEYVEVDSGLE